MNKNSHRAPPQAGLVGTGKVYRFTLRQLLKSKANIATFVIFALIAIFAVPVSSLILGGDKPPEVSEITEVYINNETPYAPDTTEMPEHFADVIFRDTTDSFRETNLSATALYVKIESGAAGGVFISVTKLEHSNLMDAELELLKSSLTDSVSKARLLVLGATQEQLDLVMSSYSTEVLDAAKYNSDDLGFAASYAVQYAYAIVLLMISMFTIVYIIRAVIEEKSSKLVELLMVTTKPLALLAGKIFAVMTYIFGMLLAFVALFVLSFTISSSVLDTSPIAGAISGMGLSADVLNLGPSAFVAVFVSLLLAYMTFSIIAGLSGTSCSTMDDVESANMSVTFTILGAYMLSVFLSASGNETLAVVGSLVPVVSAFVAPVQYILGGISFWVLAVSWVIQLAVISLLAIFSSRIYRSLIIHSGNRVELKALFSMYKQEPEKERIDY